MAYQTQKLAQWFFGVFWFLFGSGILYLNFIFWSSDYNSFTYQILVSQNRLEKLDLLRTNFLTPTIFFLLRTFSIILILFWGMLFYCRNKIISFFEFFLKKIQNYCTSEVFFLKSLSNREKVFLIISLLSLSLVRIFCSFYLPIQEDEAFTYVYFVYPGILVSSSYYPGPNNHVFYSLIVCLSKPFFFHPLWLLRAPNIFISCINNYLIFRIICKQINYKQGLLGTVIFSLLPFSFLYSFLGRGYVLQFFFLLIALNIQLSQKPQTQILRLFWILSCSLGFYTVPTFLYPFLGLCFLRIWKKDRIQKTFLDSLLVLSLVLLFYSPILLFNFDSFLKNNWIKSIEFSSFLSQFFLYWYHLFDLLFGLKYTVFLLSGIILLLFLFRNKINFLGLKYFLIFSFLGCIATFLQQVLPPIRVWIYLSFFFIWSLLEILQGSKWKHILLLGLSFYFVFYTFFNFYQSDKKGGSFREISKKTIQSQAKSIYTNDPTYFTFLQYEKIKQKSITLITDNYLSNQNPDILILRKSFDEKINLELYQIDYTDKQVVVYKLSL